MSEQHEPQSGYIAREEIGYRVDEPPTNPMRIDLSPDLNTEAVGKYLSNALEKAGKQLPETGWQRLETDMRGDTEEVDRVRVAPKQEEETVSPMLRLAIREEVERALYPGTVDPRRFASVTFTLDTGERYRGVVYGVERVEDDGDTH